ncbi:MAG: thiamine diphosphokinase [Candidatus Kapabacteria bacterium]|nr:thiamine diphosphokinase [Candidatus Kapabacteria bacterium]
MKHILSENEQLDAVILLNGILPGRDVLEVLSSIPFIAADGAANALHDMGIVPDILAGDLDSVRDDVLASVREHGMVIADPDQDINDFEKALRVAASSMWTRVLVAGLHGGELEHTLNNWSVMMRHARTMQLFALDGHRIGIPVYEEFRYHAELDELVSIIPQPHARLTTAGLQWSLTDDVLELGSREGARNRAIATEIAITVHEGSALVFVASRLGS